MTPPSITASEVFQYRAQRSEALRALLMCAVFLALLVALFARRLSGEAVMASDAMFYPRLAVTVAAIVVELGLWAWISKANRQSTLMPSWLWVGTAIFELAVPTAMMAIAYVASPRGAYASLTAPPLLVFPIVILMSVLRLRPMFTLYIGLGSAAVHWTLVAMSIRSGGVSAEFQTVLLTYGLALALTGVMGAIVTAAARRYVIESVEEATAHERDAHRLAMIDHDLCVARDIQTGLLPRHPPRMDGFDVAGMNLPADQTGGDYYDWQELPDNRLLVVMADVTGHGIGPAIVMAVCRAYARASAPLERDPALLLSRLNSLLHADLSGMSGRFITLAAALLDKDGSVELVSAGHGPTLVCRAADGSVERYGGDGLPLAVIARESYSPSRRFTLNTGDVMVMLTDGVFEWRNHPGDAEGEQFGLDRLSEAVSRLASGSAEECVQGVYQAAHKFAAGAKQADDVTVVAVKRTG